MSKQTSRQSKAEQTPRILVVDSSAYERRMLTRLVQKQGWRAMSIASGETAIDIVRKQPIDLVLLDVDLPDLDGLEVCDRIRRFSTVSIIMVTSRRTDNNKVNGLNYGADDYVTKPYSPEELAARMRAVMKRSRK